MITKTSTQSHHLNLVQQRLDELVAKVHRWEQIEAAARIIARTYDNGCSFEDLSPLMSALNIALRMEAK